MKPRIEGVLAETDLMLRPMTVQDLDAVVAIEQRIFPFPWSRTNFEDSLAAGYAMSVLVHAHHMVGYLVWMHIVDEAHLLNISVDAPYQGHGWGRWLMRQLAAAAQQAGCLSLLLEVRPSNEAALQLYRRVGFEQIGLRRRYYPSYDGAREDAVVMRADLSVAMPTTQTVPFVEAATDADAAKVDKPSRPDLAARRDADAGVSTLELSALGGDASEGVSQ